MSKVIIRRLREGDELEDFRFLKTIFGGWHSFQQWNWKFKEVEEAHGQKSIIWVMEVDGKIVGQVGAIPMKLRIGSEIFPVCQLVDVASDSSVRHKGLYMDLFNKILDDTAGEGFAASFGFANISGYRLCARQGNFRTICKIRKMFKALNISNAFNTLQIRLSSGNNELNEGNSPLKELLVAQKGRTVLIVLDLISKTLKSKLASIGERKESVEEQKLEKIDPRNLGAKLDRPWTDLSPRHKFAFERDSRFLRWRYGNPEAEYYAFVAKKGKSVAGYVVIGLEEKIISLGRLTLSGLRGGYILDLIAEEDFIMPLLLTAEQELKNQGACYVQCWAVNENGLLPSALRSRQFYQLPNELYRVFLVMKIDSPRLQTSLARHCGDDFLVSLGDSDIV